jgi:hypothetical protein
MPRTGRPPKPVELKRRLGNPGGRRLPTPITVLPAVGQPDQVPEFASGQAFLSRVFADGAKTWIGPTDVGMAEITRQVWDDRVLARAAWQSNPADKVLFRAYDDLNKRLIACLSALGLDPAARGRLGVAEVKTRSKLEELAERRQKRLAGGRQGS